VHLRLLALLRWLLVVGLGIAEVADELRVALLEAHKSVELWLLDAILVCLLVLVLVGMVLLLSHLETGIRCRES